MIEDYIGDVPCSSRLTYMSLGHQGLCILPVVIEACTGVSRSSKLTLVPWCQGRQGLCICPLVIEAYICFLRSSGLIHMSFSHQGLHWYPSVIEAYTGVPPSSLGHRGLHLCPSVIEAHTGVRWCHPVIEVTPVNVGQRGLPWCPLVIEVTLIFLGYRDLY